MSGSWDEWVDGQLDDVRAASRWRELRPLEGVGPEFVVPGGDRVVSFASNDYLGMAGHPAVMAVCADAAGRFGAGTGSSRLIVGDRPVHHHLERTLAGWRGTEAALVFPTGYQANVAVLATFGHGSARIVSDRLNHASIIDGARLAAAEVCVYDHGDVDHARRLVREAPGPALVVSDSVFSMDGDVAPIAELSTACAAEGALLVLDDAHAVFPLPDVDPEAEVLRVGTMSKALGSQGGFVAGRAAWIDLLVNRARSFIFTTGLSPVSAAAAACAVAILCSEEGAGRRARLRTLIDELAPGHPTPIVPFVLGDEQAAVDASGRLLADGLLVPAIRPPTVPEGTSRLRVSLSADHRVEDVRRLRHALDRLRPA
ncbi:MAG TPA: 8-amino-7-oxononanoate synthase [Acidimicrobiales bacterium]|nr:8-amino-7-oxononanoate synthase [Acidimicrobiales bacterium]